MIILGKRLLVSPMPQPDRTAGGIMLAEAYKPEQQIYHVLEVGTKVEEIARGQRILLDQYAVKSKVEAGTADNGQPQFIIEESAAALVFP